MDLAGNEKSPTFAPAIERDAAVIEILKTKERKHELPLQKKLFENFFWKVLVVQKKSPYLCIRFRKDSDKEEFFERFRYEQASSTRLTLSK